MHLYLKHYKLARTAIRFYSKKSVQHRIVMVRHGESNFNKLNLFCGWYDADLTEKGLQEAEKAGKTLKKEGFKFDKAFTSVLKRANITLDTILKEIGQTGIPIVKSWRLNERHYGALTGLNKHETAEIYGTAKVNLWRRSFDTVPPPMKKDHQYYNEIVNDKRYAHEPKKEEFPMCESVKLALERTLPLWNHTIIPEIKAGKRIIITGHSNNLKGIVHSLGITSEHLMGVSLPTGLPFVLTFGQNMKPVKDGQNFYFLGDPDEVKKAMEFMTKPKPKSK